MFKKVFLLFSLVTNTLFCQEKTIIIYDAFPTYGSIEGDESVKKSKANYIYSGLDNAIRNTQYEFHVSEEESYFFYIDKLYQDEKIKRLAKTFCGSDNFYVNMSTKTKIREKSFIDKIYFIKDTTKYIWEIFNEERKIDNKTCFKATTIDKKTINGKLKETLITAWFCPEIPISNGPKGFDGLPGLIIELSFDKVTLVAKSIKKVDNLTIKKINFSKIISESEYNEIVKKENEEFLKSIGLSEIPKN